MSVDIVSSNAAVQRQNKSRDVRFVGSLDGCYSLASRRGADRDVENVFACRVQSISTKGAVLSAPVSGEIDERLTVKFEQFNIIQGRIERLISGGFAMGFDANDKERSEIAAKIDWIKKRRFTKLKDKRNDKRIIPPSPRTAITMADGSVKECFVIDVSHTGVAVSADVRPAIGTRVAVGKAIGVVVRDLEVGFAVKFDKRLAMDEIDSVFAWSLNYLDDKKKHTASSASG